jgi:hypothetical protein
MLFLHFEIAIGLRVTDGRRMEEKEGYAVGGVDEIMVAETGITSFDLAVEDVIEEDRFCTFEDVGDEDNLLLLSLLLLLFSVPCSSALDLLLRPDRLLLDTSSLNQPPMTPHHPTNTLSISSSFSTSVEATPATVGSCSHSRRRENDSVINESRYVCMRGGGGYSGHGRAVDVGDFSATRFNSPDVDAIPDDDDNGNTLLQRSDVSATACAAGVITHGELDNRTLS